MRKLIQSASLQFITSSNKEGRLFKTQNLNTFVFAGLFLRDFGLVKNNNQNI